MQPEFWHERWKEGRIGFHEGKPNVFLDRHRALLGEGTTMLVPLAGKSHDMLYLAQRGHRVVGVELSDIAVQDFFRDHGLVATQTQVGPFEVWSAGPGDGEPGLGRISVFVGDFFALTQEHLAAHGAAVGGVYDRAAIVALPEELRERYVQQIRALMPAGAPGLVITFDYTQEFIEGPPFAVPAVMLRELYADLEVEEIDSAMADIPRLRELGVGSIERCFTVRF